MKIRLNGSLASNRTFVSEELPALVYQTNMDSKLGGKMLRKALKLDRLSNWKLSQDSPDQFEASVFLPKASNKFTLGTRRIGIRASDQNGKTFIEPFETKNTGYIVASVVLGLILCIVPGLLIMLGNLLRTSWNKKLIAKVGTKIKERYPEAELFDY